MRTRIRRVVRRPILGAVALLAGLLFAAPAHAGQVISPDSLGIGTVSWATGGLTLASSNGAQLARDEVHLGDNADPFVQQLAQAHMRLYPILGLPCPKGDPHCTQSTSWTPSEATTAMTQFVTDFATRYGPNGTFWAQNPNLPYLPVTSFEIGNEPNIPLAYIQDGTHMHWTDPAAYAQVYEAARSALHAVDPSGVAVFGGLADSAGPGVDLTSIETWLGALNGAPVDAIGYHPYVFMVSDALLQTDTEGLRTWLNATGHSGVPIDVNEFDACELAASATYDVSACPPSWPQHTSDQWGQVVAGYTQWAMCTPSLGVQKVLPFWWGGSNSQADGDTWLTMATSALTLTPYGQDYLSETHTLTTVGCPDTNSTTTTPPTTPTPPTTTTAPPTSSSPTTATTPTSSPMTATFATTRTGGVRVLLWVRKAGSKARQIVAAVSVGFGAVARSAGVPHVTLVLQRRTAGGWQTVRTVVGALRNGRYTRQLGVQTGNWRVWAACSNVRSAAKTFSIS